MGALYQKATNGTTGDAPEESVDHFIIRTYNNLMARPSGHTDKKLFQAGRCLLPIHGICGLSVRAVAREAGVNLGLFHYHFKTKDIFIRKLLENAYESFFERFTLETGGNDAPIERLRRAITALGRFSRDHRDLAPMLIHDVLEGRSEIIRFARENFPRHARIIVGLIRECQKEGLIRRIPLPIAITFLAGSVATPHILIGMAEQARLDPTLKKHIAAARRTILSDDGIALRVDMAIKGLCTEKNR
jgi:AcrR family transcriptional regulator